MKILLNKKYFKGFTLVELIIVITILSILSTIAYISFQGYTKDARDGVRMSDIKQIYNGLSIYKTQTEKTLLPDNYINIQSGTTTISYQGYAGASVLRTLKISGGKDPGTKDYYIYTTDVNTKKAQLMTYMETSDKDVQLLGRLKNLNIINQANAVSNTGYYQDKKIYVYGDKIGILTNNKIPLQETTSNTGIDITSLTGNITTYFGGNVYSSGVSTSTGITLVNQINGVITGKLPCNGTTYNGYTITSLQDSQSGSFTKVINSLPLIQTGSIQAICNNGVLNYSGELIQNGCVSGYSLVGENCILNKTTLIYFFTKEEVNIYNDTILFGWDGVSKINLDIIINTGIIIGSNSSANYSMKITGFPFGSTINLINNGTIIGKGGDAGITGTGGTGGSAILIGYPVNLVNNGIIAGGGGGGGKGGNGGNGSYSDTVITCQSDLCACSGCSPCISQWYNNICGSKVGHYSCQVCGYNTNVSTLGGFGGNGGQGEGYGSTLTFGTGGSIGGTNAGNGGRGGDGGGLGKNGYSGITGIDGNVSNGLTGYSGGLAGYSIDGISYVTYIKAGTILGPTK